MEHSGKDESSRSDIFDATAGMWHEKTAEKINNLLRAGAYFCVITVNNKNVIRWKHAVSVVNLLADK
ncbi:hypothetical protein ECZU24_59440 [Escherichia coli]|nr:hypothetical protein ECZU24_59440 [Escherichia coli]